MARRISRLLAIALFFITLAIYYTLQPLRDAPSILVEPESGVVLEDASPIATAVPDASKESLQDEENSGAALKEPEKVEEGPKDQELGLSDAPIPDAPAPATPQPEQPSPEPPSPATPESDPTKPARPDLEHPTPGAEETEETSDSPTDTPAVKEGWPVEEDVEEEEAEPEPPPPTKVVVIGKLSHEDTDWVAQELTDWQNAIYVVDLDPNEVSSTGLRTKMNKAREAMPYLTYIIDNYPDFPDVIAFIHPHRRGMPMAWHNDARGNDAVNMLHDLKLGTIMDRGYVNLRCNNEVGCPDEVQPFRDPPDPKKYAEHAFPYIYGHFFNVTFTTMRERIPVVATQCCAQFAVSKDQLLKLPKHEYERYRTFLEETHYDDATSGRVMEYMWHIIFGRDAVHCENMFECWCAVYGRCFGHSRGGGFGLRGGHP